MKLRSFFRLLGLSLTVTASLGWAQTLGQWNVNNNGNWFNGSNWLGTSGPTGLGTNVAINQDFSPGRMIGDVTETFTATTSAGAQTFAALKATPTNGTLSITDGTLFWSQGRGASSTAWAVSYNSGTNQITVTYSPALTANRTISVSYGTTGLPTTGATFGDTLGVSELVTTTTGALTYSKVLLQAANPAQIGVTDGIFKWNAATGSSSPVNFIVSYDVGTRTISVTYTPGNANPGKRIYVAYCPTGMSGSATVVVDTYGPLSTQAIVFTRQISAQPSLDTNFKVVDGSFIATSNGSGVFSGFNATNYAVTYTSPTTVSVTYKNTNALNTISTTRTLTTTYNPLSATSRNVTLGNLLIGDISGGDRISLLMNSLTFDNGGVNTQAQVNKIIGGPDEIASPTTLNSTLALSVRTGGDVVNKNAFLYSGNLSGVGGLLKVDSGNLVISGTNSFTGPTVIRNTGGFTFLNNTTGGTALSSNDIYLGTASRDGHAAMVLQLAANTALGTAGTVASNQIADTSRLWFDGGSGRNPYLRMFGTSETVGGIADGTSQGVIENTESENGVLASSVLTVNTASAADAFLYNGFFRNKSSGDSTGTIGLTKQGLGKLTLQGGNINYGDSVTANSSSDPLLARSTTVSGGTLALINTSNFGSNILNNSDLELGTTSDWTFNRSISGTGTVTKTGANVVATAVNNTYTGATTIYGGTLRVTSQLLSEGMPSLNGSTTVFRRILNRAAEPGSVRVSDGTNVVFAGNSTAELSVVYNVGTREITATFTTAPTTTVNAQYIIQGPGSLSGTSAINLYASNLQILNDQNSNLVDTAVGGAQGRINDSAVINSNGGTITYESRRLDGVTFAETVGTLNLQAGRTNVILGSANIANIDDTGAGSSSTLTFNSLVRAPTAIASFAGRQLGEGPTATTSYKIAFTNAPTVVNNIIGGWAVVTRTDPEGANATYDFATYLNGSITPLAAGLQRTSVANVSGANAWAAADNIRISGVNPTVAQGAANSLVPVNSIKIDDGNSRTLTINGRGLVVNSGGILSRGNTHTIARTGTGTGYLTAGSPNGYELDFWVEPNRRLSVTAPIRDNGLNPVRVVKAGNGKMILGGTYTGGAPAFSGGLTINEGTVEVSPSGFGSLGVSLPTGNLVPNFLTMNGGMLQVQNDTGVERSVIFDSQYGITLGRAGGRFATDAGLTFIINSTVTGLGGITMGDTGALDGSSGGTLDIRGVNNFQGGITINYGDVILGGSVNLVPASNTFAGPITINGGTFVLRTAGALPTTKPNITSAGVGKIVLWDSGDFGQFSGDGSINTGTDALGTSAERVFKITQDTNTTYNGTIFDSGGPVLSLEKRGKGVLTLGAGDSTYHGATRIYEGVLQVTSLFYRGGSDGDSGYSSSIGLGSYDASVAGGTTLLTADKKSAANLFIGNGAGLSYTSNVSETTDRAFTIGVGALGAGIYANSAATGNALQWTQRALYDSNFTPTGYDTIAFAAANDASTPAPDQAATLNLGGRNQGTNRFSMDLHDNGLGKLALQKSGDGQWILGEYNSFSGQVLTPSRNDFTGRTTIYQGTLGVEQNGVFGEAGGESVNLVGGNLDLRNVNYTVNEALSLAGGRLRALFGTNVWTGAVSVDVGAAVEIGTGASLRLRGAISGKGGVTKQGFGTLILEGNNTLTGGFNAQEGTLQLDYSTNSGSKLSDVGGLNLGGGRSGGILDIVGGTNPTTPIIEIVAALNLGLGQNAITRSDLSSTTIVRLNALENGRVAQGASLDIGANYITQTDRLNDSTGLLGTWLTVGKTDWAKNETNAVDGSIVGVSGYAFDTWGGAGTNTTVSIDSTFSNAATNTLRFAFPVATTTTLTGVNTILSDGILQAPTVSGKSNIITGGSIAATDNGFGGNLMIHQNDPKGSLTIDSAITNSAAIAPVTGNMYYSGFPNRLLANSPAAVAGLIQGALVTGSQIEPNTIVTAINYTTGEVTLNQGRTAEVGIAITINGGTYTGDTMVRGTLNQVRLTAGDFNALATTQSISGGIIPGGATVTAIATDPVNPSVRVVTISIAMTVPVEIPAFTLSPAASITGQMYFNAQTNRFRISPISGLTNVNVGMPVTGNQVEPGVTISSIDFFNGDVFLSQGRMAEVDVALTVNGVPGQVGDTMALGAQNRVRIKTNVTFDANGAVTNPVVNQTISGGTIPAGTVITGVAVDPVYPLYALLTISQNVPVPAIIGGYTLAFTARNGVAKFGDGTAILGGNSTYTGPTYISGGKLNVKTLANGGVPSPLGASSNAAGNLVIGGGIFGYIGDSVTTNRGFQINEIGGVEVARQGAVATFTGNLSGGVGAALGTLETSGAGTLKISQIGGNVTNSGSPVTAAQGGSTNIGGFNVKSGTLQLSYDNPNSNNNTNRFAANIASLTVGGGKLELVGLADVGVPSGTDPTENRVQQLLGQLTLNPGASQIWVTAGNNTTTTLNLQDPNAPREVVRKSGATVHLVENPNGGTANMFLSIPSYQQSVVLPWATYQNTAILNRRGVNDFAAVETADDSVINADSKDLYVIASNVATWVTNQVMSEGGNQAFSGTTSNATENIYALRFFVPAIGTVDVSDTLRLTGGAILVGSEVTDFKKTIQGGKLTAGVTGAQSNWTNGDGTADLLIHNYNASTPFEIKSTIVDNTYDTLKVNLVQGGWGTTYLSGENTYTGATMVNNGVLRLGSANALPGGIGATGGTSHLILNGGMIGLETGDFSRPLGTGVNAVEFTGSGGFAAYRAPTDTSTTPIVREVNLGGASAPVLWGSGGFVPGGQILKLNSDDADGMIRFINPIDLIGGYRQIYVGDTPADVDAEIVGALSGNGGIVTKLGRGTLALNGGTAAPANVGQGSLSLKGVVTSTITVASIDATQIGDEVTLQLDGASVFGSIAVGNKNSEGITNLKISGNSSLSGGLDVIRNIFVDVAAGRLASVSGGVTGTGRLTVNDGGSVSLNGPGTFGSSGSTQGAAIDGGVVVRNGSVLVGNNTGLGVSNVELGDKSSTLYALPLDRSSNGRSLLAHTGIYDATSNGIPGDVSGFGAFIYVNQTTLTIDGHVYGKADAAAGKRILVNGEAEHPERNGVYEFNYYDGITSATTDDVISLRRVNELNDARDLAYGSRVSVANGTAAGKTYFLATDKPALLPAPDSYGRVLITTAVLWKEEKNINPNASLLASADGLIINNTVDINNVNSTGFITLGGSAGLTGGSSTFTGNVTLQNLVAGSVGAAVETRQARLTSESLIGHGVEFSGVIGEADSHDSLSLLKIGSGTITLSGSNTYKGSTQVNAGTLLINTAVGSGTGTGAVVVSNFGSVLGGLGTISGATSILAGGSLQPGDPTVSSGAGQLNLGGSLTLGADALALFQLNSDLVFDRAVITGLLSVDSSALISVLLNYVPSAAVTFDLLDWGSLSAAGGLADRLDLPALASADYFWDVSSFNSTGELIYAQRNLGGDPPVHFSAKEGRVHENVGTVSIAVELDWAPSSNVTVPLTFGSGVGIATQGTSGDYTVNSTTLNFLAGERSKELVITVRDDAFSESKEKAVISIGTPTNANKATPSTFTLTITDNDSAVAVGDQWLLRNPMVTNETLNCVASIGSTFVAVGNSGTILTSTDGISWTPRPLAVSGPLYALASSGSQIVAVGQGGRVLTSSDGISWTIRTVGGGKNLRVIVWTGASFTAVGDDGVTYSSVDGASWTFSSSGVTNDLGGVASAPGLLVAVGEGGQVVTSTNNGTIWSAQASNTSAWLRGVAYNGFNQFAAVGDGGVVITSPDGITWTVGVSGVATDLKSIRWDGAAYLATGVDGVLSTSADGIVWTVRTSGVTHDLNDGAKLGSLFIAVGEGGTILTSTNATAWTERSAGDTRQLRSVAASGSQLVAVGETGAILTSTDTDLGAILPPTLSWTTRTSPVSARLNAVAATSTRRVAVGNTGAAVSSADGITWTDVGTGSANNLNGIAVKGTRFCAVGDLGTVFISDNGTTWTESSDIGYIENLRAVTASTSIFVAVGANGVVRTSTDGVTWTSQDNGSTATLNAVTWTGSTFVAVGIGGVVFTSPTGVIWTQRSSKVPASLTGVVGSGSTVLAVGANGTATVSVDGGNTWTKCETGTSLSFQGLGRSAAGRYIAAGDLGTLMTTESKVPPAPAVFFTNAAEIVSESAGAYNVQVSLSPAAGAKVTVPFTVRAAGTTATKTTDYTITGTSVVFNPGETTKNIVVTLKNDAVDEADETLIIDLGTPTGAGATKVAPSAYTMTIMDEYLSPTISALGPQSQFVVIGGGSPVPLDLTVTPVGSLLLKVQWQKNAANLGSAVSVASGSVVHYNVANTATSNGGKYGAKVINPLISAGLASASSAEVVVVERLAQQLKLGKAGSSVSLTANAGGNGLVYRWHRGSSPILADSADFAGTGTKTLTIKTFAAGEEDLYKCLVTSSVVAGSEFSTEFDVVIANLPDITPLATPATYPVGRVGTAYNYQITRATSDKDKTPLTWNISGLPTGLVADKVTGLISGVPTKSGNFTVKVSATNPQGTTVVSSAVMTIDAILPNAIGTFVALVNRSGSHLNSSGTFGLGARLDVTTAVNGTFSGKLTTTGTAISFTNGKLNTVNPAIPMGTIDIVRTGKSTLTLSFNIDTATNLMDGSITDTTPTFAALSGWRNTWSSANKVTDRVGTHNFMATIPVIQEGDLLNPDVPQGDTYASAKVIDVGTVTLSGKLADGTVLTGSAPLSPAGASAGQFLVHQGFYVAPTSTTLGNPGSLHGVGQIAATTARAVTGTLTWSRAPQPSGTKLYANGFATPIILDLSGGLYTAATSTSGTSIIMDAKSFPGNNAAVTFFDSSGLLLTPTAAPASNPNLTGFRINSVATVAALPTGASLKMTFTTSTGLITGSFVIADTTPGVKSRTVSYYGMVIPDASTVSPTDGVGVGFFVLKGLTSSDPDKSGRVTIVTLP